MIKLKDLIVVDTKIDIDEYIKVRDTIKSRMSNPEWLGDFTKEDIIKLLNNGSKIWMFYDNKEFVCSMMFIPSDKESIIKMNIDNINYKEVADYGPMFVNDKYRGNGLQYEMLKYLDNYSINNDFKYAVVTVHPDNKYSINNLIKDKFIKHDELMFKRGIRIIYKKGLKDGE